MTTKEFFDEFSKFLSEDEFTKPYANSFKSTLMDQTSPEYQNKIFTRTGYRIALMFFEWYGKNHKECEDPKEYKGPECFKARVEWNGRNIEAIKKKLASEYDTVMYVGKENCAEDCNFVVFDPSFITAVALMNNNIDAFLDSLEGK